MKFEVFFWLAIMAVYLFRAIAKNKNKTGSDLPVPPEKEENAAPSDFQSALSEISRMLQGEPPSNPHLPPLHYEPETPVLAQPPAPEPTTARSFNSLTSSEPAQQHFYDDSFEKRKDPTFHKPVITHDHDFDFSAFEQDSKKTSGLGSLVKQDLKDRAKTREAFILAELLGPPASRK